MQLLPIILSGGSGTRLWPVSREAMPKPFMKIGGGKSLLQLTWERACALPGVSHAAVVTNMAYSYKTAEDLMDVTGAKQISLLLEPVGRNTAPAVALAALWAQAKFGSDVVLVVLAADHLIDRQAGFNDAVVDAAALAQREGRLVLFGIEPSGPETGYGYIEYGARIAQSSAHEVERFVEKPSIGKATEYLKAGNFVWNSGMFCFTAATILAALQEHAPQVLQAAQRVAQCSAIGSEWPGAVRCSLVCRPARYLDRLCGDGESRERRSDSMRFRLERYWQLESRRRDARRRTKPATARKATRSSSTHVAPICDRKIDWSPRSV